MSKSPKYIEIIEYYKNEIESGRLVENEPLPPENEICKKFNVSHMTFTKAMNELTLKGYIHRIPRKGTIVSSAYKTTIKKAFAKPNSITSQIIDAGMEPHTELYKYSVSKGKDLPEAAKKLKIKDDDYIHFFIRSRFANHNLVCISYTYISQAIMPSIDITRLEGSLNEYIDELGIHRSYGSTEFCAALPTAEQAKLIGTNYIPLLKQTILWNVDNTPFELTYHYFVGEQYTITQDLQLIYNDDNKIVAKKVLDLNDKSEENIPSPSLNNIK